MRRRQNARENAFLEREKAKVLAEYWMRMMSQALDRHTFKHGLAAMKTKALTPRRRQVIQKEAFLHLVGHFARPGLAWWWLW